jgi:hypothetical protein
MKPQPKRYFDMFTNSCSGLNGLEGFNLTKFELLTTAQPDGSNSKGTVFIPNPSVCTYAMGNLSMSMYVGNVSIGNSTLDDVLLRPGNNTFSLRALTNETTVAGLLFTAYKSGIFPITIVAEEAVYNGQHLPYYENALRANNMTVQLNVIEVLEQAGLAGALGINTTTSGGSR